MATIGQQEIEKFNGILEGYKAGKAELESRIIANEEWFRLRHNKSRGNVSVAEKQHNSAWLFNSIANKHADAMDNYPSPNVLPRAENHKKDAQKLQKILPAVLEQNSFEQVYSDCWWYKLKTGNALYGVFWDSTKEDGIGDIEIKQCDLLNLFWESGVKNLEDSPYLFYVSMYTEEYVKNTYPRVSLAGGGTFNISRYEKQETEVNQPKIAVIDVYYKTYVGGQKQLHYCKYCGNTVIYSSENDKGIKNGWYSHGRYPFVIDTLFVEESSVTGFGYIDIMKDCQEDIDRLNDAVLRNALMCSRQRYFYRQDGSVNKQEFADWSQDFVHVQGSLDNENIRQIAVNPLPSEVFTALSMKIEELKETSGNRDFSQGGTASGVTAASAIAALQEAGSKLSRDMIKSSFRAFTKVCYLVIELIRQFYTQPRCFRIAGKESEESFISYTSSTDITEKNAPIFDITVTAEKKTPFSRVAANELAKEMYAMGFFTAEKAPQALIALEIMDFEGKELLVKTLSGLIQGSKTENTALMGTVGQNINAGNPQAVAENKFAVPNIGQQANKNSPENTAFLPQAGVLKSIGT